MIRKFVMTLKLKCYINLCSQSLGILQTLEGHWIVATHRNRFGGFCMNIITDLHRADQTVHTPDA